jgi:hypothetical protein
MATSGKGTATVGYNVQIAVDAEHHLIVAHEVINQGYDRHQLAPMALKAQQATGCEQVTALADRGYFNKAGKPVWDKWVKDNEAKGLPGKETLDFVLKTIKEVTGKGS